MSLLARDCLAPFRRRTPPAARSPSAGAEPAATRTQDSGRGRKNRLAARLRERRRPPVFGATERLERRLALAVDVIPITGNGFFFVDTGQGRVLDSEYSGYAITNNNAVTYADVWVQAHDFTGGVLELSPNEDGVYHLGQLDPGETDRAWFYLTASGSTASPQSHVISVYNGDPRQGGVLIPGATATVTFSRVEQTIEASANKVFSVSYDTANPVLGGTLKMTVTGDLGQAGGDSVLFTPDTFKTWQPGVFELETMTIEITSGPNVRTVSDELFLTGFASAASNPYTAVYTFRVVDVIATQTPVSPTQFVGRNLQWKHDQPIGGAFPPVPAVTNPLLLQKLVKEVGSMDPPAPAIIVPDTGATVEFTLKFTNSSMLAASLDSIRDTLPPGTFYVPGSAIFAGLPIGDPTIVGSQLTWLGPFAVPPMGAAILTFDAVMPAVTGVYINSSVGRVGSVQIDTTANTKDDEPATATVTVAAIADLAVKKETKSAVVAGAEVTYLITVTNNGPTTVNTVTLTDAADPVLSGVTWSGASEGTYDPSTNLWTGLTLAKTESVTITLKGTLSGTATGDLTNTVTVDSPIDPDKTNNTSTVIDGINRVVELKVTKTGDELYKGGGLLNYTVLVTNKGPSFASGVRVVDALPTGVVSWSWTVTYSLGSGTADGSPDAVTGSTVGIDKRMNLAPLGTATFAITALTDAGFKKDITNTVVATIGAQSVSASVLSSYDGPINPTQDPPALVVSNDDLCDGPPIVRVLNPETGAVLYEFLAYEPSFRGSVRVATGDVTGDGLAEIIVAPGRNRVGQIRVFKPDGTELKKYRMFPFGRTYRGGVDVAVGNIDGIGGNEIIASQTSGLSRVNVFSVNPLAAKPVSATPIRSFIGIPGAYRNGAVITAGDYGKFVNGTLKSSAPDGIDEIAVGSNAGIRAQVRVYDASATPRLVRQFFAFGSRFTGGVTLSSANWDGLGGDDIIVGAGVGGRSAVQVFRGGDFAQIAMIKAFASFARPNAVVNVAALDLDGDGMVDDLFGVQGRGGTGGTRGVTRFDRITTATSTLPASTVLAPPLRIAPIALQPPGR